MRDVHLGSWIRIFFSSRIRIRNTDSDREKCFWAPFWDDQLSPCSLPTIWKAILFGIGREQLKHKENVARDPSSSPQARRSSAHWSCRPSCPGGGGDGGAGAARHSHRHLNIWKAQIQILIFWLHLRDSDPDPELELLDISLLLHAIHNPFYWRILKKPYSSGFKSKNPRNKKTIHE